MLRFTLLGAVLTVGLIGCSNLIVSKVPLEKRVAQADDHIDGFRYYLSRPYVFVHTQIEISTMQSLIIVDPAKPTQATFMEGPRRGHTVALADMTVENLATGAVKPISEGELAAMRRAIERQVGGGVRQASFDPALAAASSTATYDAGGTTLPATDTTPLTTPALPDPKAAVRQSAQLKGPIQIVFLPDLDEQYAIRSQNCLAKTAFALKFQDGWQLSDVSAEHDSTTVVLELLNTIDTAVEAARNIASARLDAMKAGAQPAKDVGLAEYDVARQNVFQLTEKTWIKPGVYRLNKPWEQEEGGTKLTGCGLLAKLGLDTLTTVEIVPSASVPAQPKPTAPVTDPTSPMKGPGKI